MPTINKRFLLQFLLAVVALTGTLFGIHAIQAARIPDALKRQADRAADAQKPDAAIHYLRQYLEFRPDDTDTRERLAELIRARRGDPPPPELRRLYDEILRADPARHAVRRQALELYLRLGRYSDAEDHAEVLLKEFPTDAAVWQQLAAAQAGLRKFDAARASYETAVKHAPADRLAYQRLVQFVWKDLNKPQDARTILDKMVAALPADPDAYVTRARFELLTTETAAPPPAGKDPVLADVAKALELAPTHPTALLMKAERLQQHRDILGAAAALADGLAHHPGDARLVRAAAWLEVNRGNTAGAVGVLEDGAAHAKNPLDLLDLLVPLADLLLQTGDTAKTEEIIRKLDGRRGPTVKLQAKYLRARLAMRRAKWDEAVGLLTELRSEAVELPGLENQANLLLAHCFQRKGDPTREAESLKLITAKDPNNLPARTALGAAYLNAGNVAEAVREYEAAAQSPYTGGPVFTMLVQLKALKLAATDAGPEAWAQLERAVAAFAPRYGPNTADPALLLADVQTRAGKLDKAVAGLRSEVARRPGDPRLWARLAEAVADVEGVAAGLAVLDEAQGAAGDGADLRLARAELYARDPARLRPVPLLEAQTDSWPEADQVRLMYGLIDVYDRLGDRTAVLRLYKRIAARRPTEAGVWLAVGERAAAAGDAATVAEAKAALAKIDSADGTMAVLFPAWQAANATDAAATRDALVARFGPSPDRADACLALARLHQRSGNAKDAGKLFARAVLLEPAKFDTAKAYLTHLAGTGGDELVRYVAKLAADPRWAGEPFRRAVQTAAVAAGSGGAKRLLAVAGRYVERQPGGPGWLADAHAAAGLKDDSLALSEKAVTAPAATVDDWLRLALRKPEAIGQARKRLTESGFAALVAAFALSKPADRPQSAHGMNQLNQFWAVADPLPATVRRAFAQARLAILLARADRAEAIATLEAYRESDDLPPADAGWATRNLAMLLAVRGEPADRRKAADLLAAKATDTAGLSVEDRRATAAVLTSLYRYLDGADRGKVLVRAVEILEAVAKETKSPQDGLALARLYRAAGDADAAVKQINTLLAGDAGNVDYLIAALGVLVEAGQFDKAAPFADRLLQVAPADYRVIAAVARSECRAGRPDRGLALAEGYARTADPLAGDVFAKNARTAELLDELARLPKVARTDAGRRLTDAAVARYESLLPTRVEAVVAAAELLAADGRAADAFARIEKHARLLPARTEATAGVTALRTAGGTDRQFARVRQWLDAAKAEEPHSATVWLAEAEFLTLKQDYAGAEKAYKEVLKRDPRNVAALNNLAWILAPDPKSAGRALELIERAAKETGLTGELLDTRARVRLAAKQPELAEKDAAEALKQGPTPVRYFHMALALNEQRPARAEDAGEAFRRAKERGLDAKQVHPADLPAYRVFEKGMK